MARNKGSQVLFDSVTLVPSTPQTSETISVQDWPRVGQIQYLFTNGATGPTVPAQIQINFSNDNGSHWFPYGSAIVGPTGNNATAGNVIDIPPGTQYLQVVAGSNTAQNVTLRVELSYVTLP